MKIIKKKCDQCDGTGKVEECNCIGPQIVVVALVFLLPIAAYFCLQWDYYNSFQRAAYEVFWGPDNIFILPPLCWIWMAALGFVLLCVAISIIWWVVWGFYKLVGWFILGAINDRKKKP